MAGCERRAAEVGELVGVQLHGQAVAAGGVEHAADLLGRERDPLAEPVDRVGEVFARDQREHAGADHLDVGIRPPFILEGHGVRAEVRSRDVDAAVAGQRAGDGELAQLRLLVQAVAGFDLHGGDALGDQRVEAAQRGVEQGPHRGGAGRGDGGADAADGGELLVAGAREAQAELVHAVAAEDEVRCGSRSGRGVIQRPSQSTSSRADQAGMSRSGPQ